MKDFTEYSREEVKLACEFVLALSKASGITFGEMVGQYGICDKRTLNAQAATDNSYKVAGILATYLHKIEEP